VQRLGGGAGEVERPGPAVFVVQQRVAPAQVGERLCPPLLGGGDQTGAPGARVLALGLLAFGLLAFGLLAFGLLGHVAPPLPRTRNPPAWSTAPLFPEFPRTCAKRRRRIRLARVSRPIAVR